MPSAIQASSVMARAAALNNDTAQGTFTNTALLPYLQIAYDELQEVCEENNVPIINELSPVVTVTTAMTDIGGNTGPALPADLLYIQTLLERTQGSSEDFIEMTQVEFLPPFVVKTEALIYYAWQNQVIQFIGATTNRDVEIRYVGQTMGTITGPNSNITLFNAKTFLGYRTASLAARFISEDSARGDTLDNFALLAIDRLINLNTKGRQSQATRRRPFMATYKMARNL